MAVAGLVALLHDLVITVGIYSLFGFEITPSSMIGFLTILGYSLYDTVVVFDKVRENTAEAFLTRRMTYTQAANLAVNQTLVRSINTTVVALLPIAAILVVGFTLLGPGTLLDLSLALFVGIAVGAYSSIFIATPLLVDLRRRAGGQGARQGGAALPGPRGGPRRGDRSGDGSPRRRARGRRAQGGLLPPRVDAPMDRTAAGRTAPTGGGTAAGPVSSREVHKWASSGQSRNQPRRTPKSKRWSMPDGSIRELVLSRIRDIPDFPQAGVLFKDFTPLLADGEAFGAVVEDIAGRYAGAVDVVVGIEARGFILGAAVAYHLGSGFVPVRKSGKLPGPRCARSTPWSTAARCSRSTRGRCGRANEP